MRLGTGMYIRRGKSLSAGRFTWTLLLIFMLVSFSLAAGAAYAQSDRKKKSSEKDKSTPKRESPSRRSDKSTVQKDKSQSNRRSGESDVRRRESTKQRRDGGNHAAQRDKTTSRQGDNGRSTVDRGSGESSNGHEAGDRADRRKGSSDDRGEKTTRKRDGENSSRGRTRKGEVRDREDGTRKKENPGHGKKIIKPGFPKHFRKDPPRPGRKEPDDLPDMEIIEDDWVPPDPWLPPPPPPPFLPPPDPLLPPYPDIPDESVHIPASPYEIFLPAGIMTPDEIEEPFLEKLEHLMSIGYADSLIVCLLQTRQPMSGKERDHLFDSGITFYVTLTDYTSIVDVSVEDILLLVMELPNFRWIGEYKSEYKYRHETPGSTRRGAYVFSLCGDSMEFRNSLGHLGIEVVTYYDSTGDYYVIADWERFPEIAEFWWVRKIYKEPEGFSEIY